MLAYLNRKMIAPQIITMENQVSLEDSIWIDLFSPSIGEEEQVEQYIGRNIPTRAEMVEIEFSSRLYKENDVLFMTAMMLAQSDSPDPQLDPVTFVLTQKQLITIRYIESQSFKLFISKVKKMDFTQRDAVTLLIELLDATVDRLADILELVGSRLDHYSKTIFGPQNNPTEKLDYLQLMQQIGAHGDLNTKARESLVTFNRLISFFGQTAYSKIGKEGKLRLATLSTDVASLSDHANFLSTKVNFLLDATLGMISIEQNNIIKIFSVAAVIFLPPTLVASIYGMNFQFMPELSWKYGYLFAIGLILSAAWLPYKYFKHRKWL
ncbi:magnesium/cobalt transporter CorA [Legionella rowbothamii]|uniref:magnesium/cobalt transporter CorA n=1 Tax=Legionella rowbothamii TaxID=96229 RepID=UPI001A93CEB5|nr:magnesium/cobalt transporter CorA [Legionella rowbothamii]